MSRERTTLLEAWASHKNFKPKDGPGPGPGTPTGRNAEVNFHGDKRTNDPPVDH